MAGPYYPKTYRAAASVNSAVLRDEQCNLGHLVFTNDGATECFLKLYDSASAPGTTDVPVQRYWLPPTTYNQGLAIGAGLKFKNGLAIRITDAIADDDAGAVDADQVLLNYSLD
jgi:hypothetical protein